MRRAVYHQRGTPVCTKIFNPDDDEDLVLSYGGPDSIPANAVFATMPFDDGWSFSVISNEAQDGHGDLCELLARKFRVDIVLLCGDDSEFN